MRRVDQDVRSVVKSYGVYLERQSNAFDSRAVSLNFMRNIVLDGFFQSWRYVSANKIVVVVVFIVVVIVVVVVVVVVLV